MGPHEDLLSLRLQWVPLTKPLHISGPVWEKTAHRSLQKSFPPQQRKRLALGLGPKARDLRVSVEGRELSVNFVHWFF